MNCNSLKSLIKTRAFIFLVFVMILKIVLMGLFSSDYQNKLFIPFTLDFVRNGGNAYQRAYESGFLNAFPYPPMMLIIESFGAFVINALHITNVFAVNFIFKLPSFTIDFLGLYILMRFFPDKKRYAAVFYYASPIVLYAVYMHGQLDLIPMDLLVIALYFLVSKKSAKFRYGLGILFTVFAVLCKYHILAVLPIVFLYLQKRDGIKKAVIYAFGVLAGSVLGIAPVWSEGFRQMVMLNSEQGIITRVSFTFGNVEVYIPIVAVLVIYLLAFKINYMNRELFLNLCGVIFAVFLAFCPPMPGWYVWIVPFMSLFFASISREKYKNIYIYVVLNGIYLVYFVLLHNRGLVDLYFLNTDCSFLKYDSAVLLNFTFTLLSGVLIYLVVSMYQLGVASNNLYKRKDIPFTIGISGDSGAGKTTMLNTILSSLGKNNILFLEGDGDHRWERGEKNWDDYTALNPKANFLYRQANDLRDLRSGSAVRRVDYDHKTGHFTRPIRMKSKNYVILCGLHALYLPQTRKHLDLKIYMDSDETLRRFWKIQRDTISRGHTKEAVLASIEERQPDAEKYIYPQKDYADFVIRYYDKSLTDCTVDKHEEKISIQLTLSADVNIEPLIDELMNYGIKAEYEYSDDLERQIVNIDAGEMERVKLPVEEIAESIIPQLEEITRERFDNCADTKDGIIILFLLLLISNKMQGVS